jgi:hypothetical protein
VRQHEIRKEKMKARDFITEKWSQKYKKSINCSHPKGFSQKAHCAGKKKHNESTEMEMVCAECGMCESHANLNEIKKGQKDSNGFTKCWPGKHAEGTKTGKNGKPVRNCVPNESVAEAEERIDPILIKALNNMPDGLATHGQVLDAAYDAYAMELGKMAMRSEYGVTNVYIPKLLSLYKDKHGLTFNESFNGEYDDEAGMFKNDLQTIQRVSTHLEREIKDNENLPEWCQAKISQAKGMIVAVMDYMISQHENGIVDTMNEEFDLIESIIDTIAERNGVDAEVIWEDLESLTDDELYVFATTTPVMEDWQKVNKKDKTDGMSKKAVSAYRREHPGSKLKTAVTTKPSKLKKGSKSSKRRKSYCSRSKGQMNMHNISCAKTPDKAICKARRRWNC